jgi:hypothetical protein
MFNKIATKTEVAFNIAGSLPVISIASGALRMAIGKTQLVAGLVLFFAGTCLSSNSHNLPKNFSRAQLNRATRLGNEHVKHGALNLIRGAGEFSLGVSTMGLGNLALFALQTKNKFQPIYGYAKI